MGTPKASGEMMSLGSLKIGGILLLLIFCSLEGACSEEPQVFKSGTQQVSLLELYTSEGCSSCPPAESWFSSLKDNPSLWGKFVPVAFHVDYWNDLGWIDPYSSRDYSDRQRAYATAWHTGNIYTPEFLLNGKEWKPDSLEIPQSGKSVGSLKATLRDDGNVEILFKPTTQSSSSYEVEVALLSCGISNAVARGENSGRTLHHDFVVRLLLNSELVPSEAGIYKAVVMISTSTSTPAKAIAIWVRAEKSLEPIQAIGGWLHENAKNREPGAG
jgi:hypothetical protein